MPKFSSDLCEVLIKLLSSVILLLFVFLIYSFKLYGSLLRITSGIVSSILFRVTDTTAEVTINNISYIIGW
ncbi:MAG: hypothetical protein AB8U30_05565 [Rickettsiales endosymbiont of Dermacentor nuttalli]